MWKRTKGHDLTLEKLQRARGKWNDDRMKRLDFIIKRLRENNEVKGNINNVNEEMLECYRVFAKQIKPLPPEPESSDFYHPSKDQNLVNYALCKYLK